MICAVLAGGDSRTFGRDKLTYKVYGKPLIMYCIERVERSKEINKIVIVTREGREDEFKRLGYDVIVDNLLVGPIGGIYVTLLEFGEAFVVGGDMPLIVPEFVDFIVKMFRRSRGDLVVPLWPNGFLEPLHAVYSRGVINTLKESIQSRSYRVQDAIRRSRACFIKVEDLPRKWHESFFNVNTMKDIAEFVKRLKMKAYS